MLLAAWAWSGRGVAGDLDLEDDDDDASPSGDVAPSSSGFGSYSAPPVVTIKPHAYTLAECLALADRNHPNLWAARARLAHFHAQLDEAKWTPYWQWSTSATTGLLPPVGGTPFYGASPRSVLQNPTFGAGWEPFMQFGIRGVVPIYTFDKIGSIARAAEAQVRLGEWDVERERQTVRMDVRRAYYGLMLARDARYVADEVLKRLDAAIDGIRKKVAEGDGTVEQIDQTRLEIYRDQLVARASQAKRGESYALAALRFLTGIQSSFDIPDEPLKRPEVALGPVVRYLTAARLFRADVNKARAGVAARRAQVEHQRAWLFPNIGVGLGAGYSVAPSATPQTAAWLGDPFNAGFGFSAQVGVDWALDLLPKSARIAGAEAQLEEARAFERLALGGVAVEVENAYSMVVDAKTREEAWASAEKRSKQWISSVQDAIDLGTKDERWMIEPMRFYVDSRVSHMQALMDYAVALSDLARVSGLESAAPQE